MTSICTNKPNRGDDMAMERDKEKKAVTVCISGGFDPIHDGHIDLIVAAKKLGDRLVCIVNDDDFLVRKKGKPFYPSVEVRGKILEHIREIDEVVVAIDDDQSVCKTLELIKPDIFANGGDRNTEADILEAAVCQRIGCRMVFGVGGNHKTNSSSELQFGATRPK